MRVVILAVSVLLLVGYDTTLTGYNYDITAFYRAPKSGLVVEVDTNGHVPAGADTSDSGQGEVTIRPAADTADSIVLNFEADTGLTYRVGSGASHTGKWSFRESENTLTSVLARAKYTTRDAAEIAELVRAINGALGGPKSVILDGQSTSIEVMSVRLE